MTIDLESLLTSPAAFGLERATPVQRAACRAIDGLPLEELAHDAQVQQAFGGIEAIRALPTTRPKEFILLAATRTAKSMIAAATELRAALTVDISELMPGEIPRAVVVSLTMDNARATFDHLKGTMMARPSLRPLLLEEPKTDSMLVRSQCGRPVEVAVVPLSRAGGSLVSRWLVGAIFDEAPRMIGEEDGVKNLSDARANAVGRLLPGAQMGTIGSPWAPYGPVYELVHEYFGKPSERLVVVRGTGPMLNPAWWTPERCEALKVTDPLTYRTDVLGEFADSEWSLISSIELDAVERRQLVLPPQQGQHYVATMDPATRGNAWTLTVGTRDSSGKLIVVLAKQWLGSKSAPLSPEAVLTEAASILRPYRVIHVCSDQFAVDAIRDLARQVGLQILERAWDAERKLELFEKLRLLISRRQIELPADPKVRGDLLMVAKRVTRASVAIELPKTTDGRHCDYAAAIAMMCGEFCPLPDVVQSEEEAIAARMARRVQHNDPLREIEASCGIDPYDALSRALEE